jgi:hypothetical protein
VQRASVYNDSLIVEKIQRESAEDTRKLNIPEIEASGWRNNLIEDWAGLA